MKKFAIILLVLGLAATLAACGTPAPATEAPATEASQPDTPTTVPDPATEEAVEPSPEPAATEAESNQEASPPEPADAFPTPHPEPVCIPADIPDDPNVPPVTDADWIRGPEDAEYILIEYADFQCPACSAIGPLLEQTLNDEGRTVAHVYRHFPLTSIHDKAMITGEASEAAGAQGKFWEMYDLLYARQQEWSALPVDAMPEVLAGYAEEIGLDVDTFNTALEEHSYLDIVQGGYDESVALELPGTPSFIVDGVHYPTNQLGFSPQALDIFFSLVELKRTQFDEPPPMVIDGDKNYQATIETEKGDIVLDLYADQTPVTVNNFVYLAQEGYFDNTSFHRVVPGFVAQAGDPTSSGVGWPGYRCSDELYPELAFDGAGILGMANSGPDTNGSQFFITMDAQPNLDGLHTVFGKVSSGMDVVESLSERDPQTATADNPGDLIVTVTIEEM